MSLELGTLAEMQRVADRLLAAVQQVSDQAFLVGQLRRGQPATDVELLVVARKLAEDLFGNAEPDMRAVWDCVNGWGETVRRSDGAVVCTYRTQTEPGLTHTIRVVVHVLSAGTQVGLAIARLIGPPAFFNLVVKHLNEQGYRIEAAANRLVSSGGQVVAVPDEAALFVLANMRMVSPEDRAEMTLAAPGAQSVTTSVPRSSVSRNHIEHQGRGMPIERD